MSFFYKKEGFSLYAGAGAAAATITTTGLHNNNNNDDDDNYSSRDREIGNKSYITYLSVKNGYRTLMCTPPLHC